MIAWNGFSCKWGPFRIIPDKKVSHFGNGSVGFGTHDGHRMLFGKWPPLRHYWDTLETGSEQHWTPRL